MTTVINVICQKKEKHKKWNSSKVVLRKQQIQMNSMKEFILRLGLSALFLRYVMRSLIVVFFLFFFG